MRCRALYLTPVLVILLLLAACGNSQKPLSESGTTAYLPPKAHSVYLLPSYRVALQELFSMAAVAFGKESSAELKDKIFSILSWQWKLPLLEKKGIRELGVSATRPILIAAYKQASFYVSIPLTNPKQLERSLKQRFPDLRRIEDKQTAFLEYMRGDATRFRIADNRLYIFHTGQTGASALAPGPAKGAFPAAAFAEKRGVAAWLSARSLRETGIPLLSLARSAAFLSYSRSKNNITIHARLLRSGSDPFAALLRGEGLGRLVPLFTYMPPGFGLGDAAAPGDLLFLQAGISTKRLWSTTLYPLIRQEVMKRIGTLGNLANRLFGPNHSPVDAAIRRLGIKEGILDNLTGRVALRVHSLSGIPAAANLTRILDAVRGTILIESHSNRAAKTAIERLGQLLKLTGVRLDEREEKNGFVYYSLPLFRFGLVRYLYLSIQGEVIVLSWKKKEVLGKSNDQRPQGGGQWAAAGTLSGALRNRPFRYWLSISIKDFITGLGKQFDWKTRANLGPLTTQLNVIPRITTILTRSGSTPVFSAHLVLKREPPQVDPFEQRGDSSDPVLYGLGAFFLSLFLLAIGRWLYKKIRYRG